MPLFPAFVLAALPTLAGTPPALPLSELKQMTMEDLLDIEVTSVSRSESTVGESPAAVFVITPEMIRRSGATAFPELFRMVPGMNVARIDGNKWAVSARGFNQRFQDKLLVLVDGRTVYTPAFSGVYWDTVDYPLEDVARIEIIRGPGASVWGANAVNGVINIVTRSAGDTQGTLVSGGGGTTEQAFGTFRQGGTVGESFSYRYYGKGFTRDETFAEVGDPHDRWRSGRGGVRLDWSPSQTDALTLDGSYLYAVAGRRDERAQIAAPFSFLNLEDETTNGGHMLARWTRQLDENSNWSAQVYWDHFSRLADNLPVRLRVDTYDAEFQHQFVLGDRQKIVYGVGYRYRDTFIGSSGRDDGFALTFQPADARLRVFSVFLQDQIALAREQLELTLGSKFEHNDFTGFEVQPTIRLLATPTPKQSLWAAISRAVRTPNLSENSGNATLLPGGSPPIYPRAVPNRDFESEELTAYEFGYRAQVTDALATDLALFYNDYDSLRVSVPGTLFTDASGATIRPLQVQNAMKGETRGAEVGVLWQATAFLQLHATYTYLKMNLQRDAGLPASSEAAEGQSPRHQAYLRSSMELARAVELDLIGRFVDGLRGFNPGGANDTIAAYTSLDLRLAWRSREGLTLELVGQNLLDRHHPEFGTSSRIRAPVAEARRGIYGKATWIF